MVIESFLIEGLTDGNKLFIDRFGPIKVIRNLFIFVALDNKIRPIFPFVSDFSNFFVENFRTIDKSTQT